MIGRAVSRETSWTRRKFEWLKALIADNETRGIAHDIATLFAIKYFNSESHEAWPAIETLASDLNVSTRGCSKAINKLVAKGWLKRKRGGGRHCSNTYRLPKRIPDLNGEREFYVSAKNPELQSTKPRTAVRERVNYKCEKPRTAVRPSKREIKERIRERKRELACCRFRGHRDKVFNGTGELECREGSSAASSSLRQ
jgi:hypothetical protein